MPSSLVLMVICDICGKMFTPQGSETVCPDCKSGNNDDSDDDLDTIGVCAIDVDNDIDEDPDLDDDDYEEDDDDDYDDDIDVDDDLDDL